MTPLKLRPTGIQVRRLTVSLPSTPDELDLLTPRRTDHDIRLFLSSKLNSRIDIHELEYVTQQSQGLKSKNPISYHLGRGLEECLSTLIYVYRNPELGGYFQVIVSHWEKDANSENVFYQRLAHIDTDPYALEIDIINLNLRLGQIDSQSADNMITILADSLQWVEITL